MKYSRPPARTSYVCTMFGWFSRAARRASSMNIDTSSACSTISGRSFFSATSLLKPCGPNDSARKTSACPPPPSREQSRYFSPTTGSPLGGAELGPPVGNIPAPLSKLAMWRQRQPKVFWGRPYLTRTGLFRKESTAGNASRTSQQTTTPPWRHNFKPSRYDFLSTLATCFLPRAARPAPRQTSQNAPAAPARCRGRPRNARAPPHRQR